MKIKRILIYRTEQLGDFIVTIPVFNEIRNKYPDAELTIVLKKLNYDFARNLNIFDNIIVYEDPFTQRNVSILKIMRHVKNITGILKHFLWIRKQKYDVAIDFSGRKYNKIRFRFVNATKKIYADPERIRKIDERERLFEVVREIGVSCPKKQKFLNLDLEAEENAENIFKKYSLKNKKVVSVHPLTPLEWKNWPLEKFRALFDKLKNTNIIFLLLGTKEEKEKVKPYFKGCNNIIDLMGELSLFETYEIIKRSNLFLGLDSSPLHLAKYTDTPLIAIFGNENLEYTRWGPKRKKDKGFEKNNLNELEVSDIADAVVKMVGRK